MKKICMFYFSGTGMTEIIAKKLKEVFLKQEAHVSCLPIDSEEAGKVPFHEVDIVGILYPVHAFNAPELVVNFAKTLPVVETTDTFIVFTAGEDAKVNYAASETLIRVIEKKGYQVYLNKLIQMPSNFIIGYDTTRVREIMQTVDREVKDTGNHILHHTSYFETRTILIRFMAMIAKAEWLGAKVMGKFFYANQRCNTCGKCVNNCPQRNITNEGGKIRFHWKCAICMRCVYRCPQEAIDIRHPFRFIKLKQWYDLDEYK